MQCWHQTPPYHTKIKEVSRESRSQFQTVFLWRFQKIFQVFGNASIMMDCIATAVLSNTLHAQNNLSFRKGQSSNCRQRLERCGRQLHWPSRKSMVTTSQVKQVQHPCSTCKRWASTCRIIYRFTHANCSEPQRHVNTAAWEGQELTSPMWMCISMYQWNWLGSKLSTDHSFP